MPEQEAESVRAHGDDRPLLVDRFEGQIALTIASGLDRGILTGVGIAAIAGSLGYLHGLWVTVDQGHAELGIFLDPAFGVVSAGIFAGAGALALGYNTGWQADAEVDDL